MLFLTAIVQAAFTLAVEGWLCLRKSWGELKGFAGTSRRTLLRHHIVTYLAYNSDDTRPCLMIANEVFKIRGNLPTRIAVTDESELIVRVLEPINFNLRCQRLVFDLFFKNFVFTFVNLLSWLDEWKHIFLSEAFRKAV